MEKGMVQVYTGDGKGKTTASLGLALRAAGSGLSVLMIQFLKGREYGEIRSAKTVRGLSIIQSGTDEFIGAGNPSTEDIELARRGVLKAAEAMAGGEYDLIILDEANVAVQLGVLDVVDILNLIDAKPPGVELVITGRGAPQEFLEKADLVTEMKNIKHYYDRGIESREGIEF